jgi:hypothetical protein
VRRASLTLVASATMTLGVGCSDIEKLTNSKSENEAQVGRITLGADSTTIPPGGSTTIHVKVTGAAGGAVPNGTRVEMTARLGRIEPAEVRTNGGTADVGYHAGSKQGDEVVTAVVGDARAELPLSLSSGPPASASSFSGGGDLDLRQVTWLDVDVSGWPETSRITNAFIGDPPICFHHTKAGQWPVRDGAEGNPWIFVKMSGRWYGATFEWLSPGQQCKGITRDSIGPHIGRSPLSGWRPKSGELVGLMVSARARSGSDTVRERSNVVMVRWP